MHPPSDLDLDLMLEAWSVPLAVSEDRLEWRFDEWKAGKERVLLITGLSGSGKTTLAEELRDEYRNASWLVLDYWLHLRQQEDPNYDLVEEIKRNGVRNIVKVAPPGPMIIEGAHLAYINPAEAKKHALIVMGTSFLASGLRSVRRSFQPDRRLENPIGQYQMNRDIAAGMVNLVNGIWGTP